MKESLDRDSYTSALLLSYLALPDTPSRSRPPDRALAHQLYVRQIPLQIIQQALLLATARRCLRPPDAPSLQPIRSLYYFVPVIQELLHTPLPAGYSQYLRRKLAPLLTDP